MTLSGSRIKCVSYYFIYVYLYQNIISYVHVFISKRWWSYCVKVKEREQHKIDYKADCLFVCFFFSAENCSFYFQVFFGELPLPL